MLLLPSWYPTPRNSYAGIFFRDQALALKAQGCQVGVVTTDLRSLRSVGSRSALENRWQTAVWADEEIPTFRLAGWNPGTASLRRRLDLRGFHRVTRKYIRTFGKPDVIHAHSALWGGVAAMHLSEELDVPYAITEHSSAFMMPGMPRRDLAAARMAFTRADAVIAVSSALAEALSIAFPRVAVQILPNVVDTSFFDRPLLDRTTTDTFSCVGSLVPGKRISLILRGIAEANRYAPVRLHVIGAGQEQRRLHEESERLGLGEVVRFLGPLPRSRVIDELAKSIAIVSASDIETFGLVIAEAQALGVPAVATDSGGPKDILTGGKGILLERNAEHRIGEALRSMHTRRKEWNARSTELRVHAFDHYHPRVIGSRLTALYESLVG